MKVKVDEIAEIDYSLIQSPVFTSSYIETQHKVKHVITIKYLLSYTMFIVYF